MANKYNIAPILQKNGGYTFAAGGREMICDCPFCNKERHMYVSTVKPTFYCHRCNETGTYLDVTIAILGVSAQEAWALLQDPSLEIDWSTYNTFVDPRVSSPNLDPISATKNPLADFVPLLPKQGKFSLVKHKILAAARKRFTDDDILYHSLGVILDEDSDYYKRLIIPIFDRDYFTARSVKNVTTYMRKTRYINPPFEKNDLLFNSVALELYEHVIICEGFSSAIACGRNSVAVMGKDFTDQQLYRLAKSNAEIFTIAFDCGVWRSPAVWRAAKYLYDRGKQIKIRNYAWGDPDENRDDYTVHNYSPILAARAALNI